MRKSKIFSPRRYSKKKRWLSFLSFFKRKSRMSSVGGGEKTWRSKFDSRHQKKQKFKLRKSIMLMSFFGVLVIFWSGLVIYLPYFHVSNFSVEGTRRISDDSVNKKFEEFISSKKLFVIPQKNYFFITQKGVSKLLTEEFPIENVILEKEFPSKIKITIEEKGSVLIYDNGKDYYLVDAKGSLVEKVQSVSDNDVKTIAGEATSTIHFPNIEKLTNKFGDIPVLYSAKDKFVNGIDSNMLHAISNAKHNLGSVIDAGKVHHFLVDPDNDEYVNVSLLHDDGSRLWSVKFSVLLDQDVTWKNFEYLWAKLDQSEKANLKYIDLRYPERGFYKSN